MGVVEAGSAARVLVAVCMKLGVMRSDSSGNLPPMPGVLPDYSAPMEWLCIFRGHLLMGHSKSLRPAKRKSCPGSIGACMKTACCFGSSGVSSLLDSFHECNKVIFHAHYLHYSLPCE